MSVETNDFYDIIPWKYSSTKIDKDVDYICSINEETKLGFCISSRKAWLTQAFNRVTKDEIYSKAFKIKGTQSHNRYKDTLQFLEERMGMLVNAYRRHLQLFPLVQKTTLDEFTKIEDTYWKNRDVLDQLLDSTDSTVCTAPAPTSSSTNDSVPKAASELKPDQLTENSMPQAFVDWVDKAKVYFSANKLLARPNSEQIQYARSFMSSQLWHLVRDKITPEMPVFKDKTDASYVENEMNCLIDVLEKEFLRLHPTITRRLEIFKKRQRADQSSLAFASELKRDALAANLSAITEEDIICILLLNGISNDSLRREILDAFDIEDKLSISELEHEIRKWEANRRTNNYVQGRSSDLFKLSSYKKQQNLQKRSNIICHKCGEPGHIAPHCTSISSFHNACCPSFRPESRGQDFSRGSRSANQPTDFLRGSQGTNQPWERSQSKPRRDQSPPIYKKSDLLYALTQDNDITFEKDESGNFVNYCRSLTTNFDCVNDDIFSCSVQEFQNKDFTDDFENFEMKNERNLFMLCDEVITLLHLVK